ncbi:MAG: hypothetical protein NT005_13295, partial [Spirochaetes bacterium]|nr:hypothetical protein [Spirochaetota bacterium]
MKPGVTDPVALTARDALRGSLPGGLPPGAVIQTGVQYLVGVEHAAGAEDAQDASDARCASGIALDELARFFHNPLIQTASCISREQWESGARPPARYSHTVAASPTEIQVLDLEGLGEAELIGLSKRRLLALSAQEMRAVQGYF